MENPIANRSTSGASFLDGIWDYLFCGAIFIAVFVVIFVILYLSGVFDYERQVKRQNFIPLVDIEAGKDVSSQSMDPNSERLVGTKQELQDSGSSTQNVDPERSFISDEQINQQHFSYDDNSRESSQTPTISSTITIPSLSSSTVICACYRVHECTCTPTSNALSDETTTIVIT